MLIKKISTACYFLLCAFALIMTFSFLFFLLINYQQLVTFILNEIKRPDLYTIISTQYFTAEKYHTLKWLSFILSPLSLLSLLIMIRYRKRIELFFIQCATGLHQLTLNFVKTLFSNSKAVNYLLALSLLLLMVRSIYYAEVFYVQFDEAWNYNYFLHKNILYSLFAYNNYPLHNIVTWFFVHLLPDTAFIMRLPSIFTGIMSCLLVFVMIKKWFHNEWIALCTMLLFSCLPISVFYILYARGVILEIFFAVLITYFLQQYLQQRSCTKKLLFISMLNALATLSMLSHVYFIAASSLAVLLYYIVHKRNPDRFLFLYPALSVAASLLALSPMLAGTGLSLGLTAAASEGSHLTLRLWPFHCYADFSTGIWFGFYILLLLNLALLLSVRSRKYLFLLIFNLSLLSLPFIIKFITGVNPPERAMAFLVIIPFTTFALFFYCFPVQKMILTGITFALGISMTYIVYHHQKLNWSKELDKKVFELATILKSHRIKTVYNNNPAYTYYIPGVTYYYLRENREIVHANLLPGSTRYAALKPAGTDCIVTSAPQSEGQLLFQYETIYVYSYK